MEAVVAYEVYKRQQQKQLPAGVQRQAKNEEIGGSVVGFLIGVWAAWLSWSCNSAQSPNMHVVEKTVRAAIAFWFSILYLILYLFFWNGQCSVAKAGLKK